jgi:hypothetical protein
MAIDDVRWRIPVPLGAMEDGMGILLAVGDRMQAGCSMPPSSSFHREWGKWEHGSSRGCAPPLPRTTFSIGRFHSLISLADL